MSVAWLLVLLMIIKCYQATVVSFGFTKSNSNKNSGQDDNVTLTLYWNMSIYSCVIFEDPS